MMTDVNDILAHHGVKGMKWGVRRDGSVSETTVKTSRLSRPETDVIAKQKPGQYVQTKGGAKQVAADDAIKVAAARQLAKKSTTDSLTTKQLQEAVTRMNLEMQYHDLVKKSDRRTRGQRFIQQLLGIKHPSEQQQGKKGGKGPAPVNPVTKAVGDALTAAVKKKTAG